MRKYIFYKFMKKIKQLLRNYSIKTSVIQNDDIMRLNEEQFL